MRWPRGARAGGSGRGSGEGDGVQIRYQPAPDGQDLVDALRPLAQWSMRRGAYVRGTERLPSV